MPLCLLKTLGQHKIQPDDSINIINSRDGTLSILNKQSVEIEFQNGGSSNWIT